MRTAELHSLVATIDNCSNISYRMVDYWLRTGVITITRDGAGSGSRRGLSTLDVARLLVIDRWLSDMPFGRNPGGDTTLSQALIPLIWDALDAWRWPDALYVFFDGARWRADAEAPLEPSSWIYIDLIALRLRILGDDDA